MSVLRHPTKERQNRLRVRRAAARGHRPPGHSLFPHLGIRRVGTFSATARTPSYVVWECIRRTHALHRRFRVLESALNLIRFARPMDGAFFLIFDGERQPEKETMDRRDFLKTNKTVIAGATLAPRTLASRSARFEWRRAA